MYEPQVEAWVPAAAAEVAEALQKDLQVAQSRAGDRDATEHQYTPDEDPLLNTMAQFDTEVGGCTHWVKTFYSSTPATRHVH